MPSRRRDEIAHILARDTSCINPSEECRHTLRGSRPLEHVLISAGDFAAGSLRRDAKKVSFRRNGTRHALRELRGDVLINAVPWRECDVAL